MALAVWQRTIVDEAGNVIPGASVEVRSEATGNLAILKSVRSGATGMSNPATADADGFVQFFTAGGSYRVVASSGAFSREWRYVGIGTAQEVDVEDIHGFSGLNYLRSTSTASDAAPGTVRGNSADLAGATALYFASLDNHTNDQSNRIVHYGDSSSEIRGSITLHQLAGGGEITFNVTGLSVDLREASPQLDVIQVPVAYTSGIDVFANGDSVSVEFSRTGDKGLATGVADGDKVDLAVLGDTWTINPGVVTYAKMQDVSATARFLGRITAGAGDTEELTGTQATTLLDNFTDTLKGLVPLSGGGTTSFLRADGTWVTPSGAGDVAAASSFAADERIIRSDGTAKGVQASTAALTDAGALSGITTLITSGALTIGTTAGTAPVIDPSGFGQLPEIAAPATPASGHVRLYAKADGHLYQKDDAGLETDLATSAGVPSIPQGRLTLVTATPVMVTTQSAKTTVYYAPRFGLYVPLYNGTTFTMTSIVAELSQATTDATKSPAAAAANSNYDLFVWSDSGTMRCTRGPPWTSDTGRGTGAGTTELVNVNGIELNAFDITNGPAASRGTCVGTIRTNASSQVDFIFGAAAAGGTAAVIGLENKYNRVKIGMLVQNTTASWSYNSTTPRQPNGSTTFRVYMVRGSDNECVSSWYHCVGSGGAAGDYVVALSYDGSTTPIGQAGWGSFGDFGSVQQAMHAGFPGLGWHYVNPLEMQATTATSATYFGVVGGRNTNGLLVETMY